MKIVTPNNVPHERCTHSRSSTASYFDEQGFMRQAEFHELRYTYHPDTLDFEGVLIEPKRDNFVPNSSNRNNQTFNFNVSASGGIAIVSFYGGGTLTLTGPGLPSTGLTISGTVGKFERAFAAFPNRNGTYTMSFSGIGRYVQYEIAPFPAFSTSNPTDGLFVDGAEPTSSDLSDPDFLASIQRPTSWISTENGPATRQADTLSGYGIIDSTFTDPAHPYNPEKEYALGEEALVGSDVYESAENGNIGNDPLTTAQWFRVRTSNEFAFLDLEQGDRSSVSGVGRAAIRLQGTADTATLVDFSANLVGLATSRIVYDLFNNPYAFYQSSFVDFGKELPTSLFIGEFSDPAMTERHIQFSADIVSVELKDPDTVELGEIVVGNAFDAGDTQYGVSTGIIDFSRKETDPFGNFKIIKRGFSKRLDLQVWVEKEKYNALLRRLYALRASPTVWVGTDLIDYAEGGIAFGYYRDFSVVISYPTFTVLSIEVESLA